MTEFSFPYRIGSDGVTADVGREDHIRDMIEQVLFTRKGERVNRPDFGASVGDLLFNENAPEMAAAVQHMVQSALQNWLAGVIEIRGVDARSEASMLTVTVWYRILDETTERSVTLTRSA
jgi:phage baseplate assembly protein W